MEKPSSYKELFERSPDAFLIMEGDRFIDCNPAAVRMLRFRDKQSLLERYSGSGRPGSFSAHPAEMSPEFQPDGERSWDKAARMIALTFDQGNHTFEWTHLRADGELLLVEVQLTAVRRGPVPRIHVVWRDIAERKRMEAELMRVQRLDAIGNLAGGIAHDLNNLLAVTMGAAELLGQELAAGRPHRAHLDQILEASERAAQLTSRLLSLSRGQPTPPRPTDLNSLVRGLQSLLTRAVNERITFDIDTVDRPAVVYADPTQLEQIVMNLVVNACEAMSDGGRLRLGVSTRQIPPGHSPCLLSAGEYISLTVSDTGKGMTEEQAERAFDLFYTTKAERGGSGLGLATVHSIARSAGGLAQIQSEAGRGTTVEVLFPVCHETPDKPAERRTEFGPGDGETVLLVDDEKAITELLELVLSENGYRVITANSGEEAMETAGQWDGPIDALVTDVVMPDFNGPELARRLLAVRPGLSVLLMSGYAGAEEPAEFGSGEHRSVLTKPFGPADLLAELRGLLDARVAK